MVYESRVGDVFTLGSSSWRIEEITHDRVVVTPAFGLPGKVPFWKGDGLGRPKELGEAIGAFARWAVEQDDGNRVAARSSTPADVTGGVSPSRKASSPPEAISRSIRGQSRRPCQRACS